MHENSKYMGCVAPHVGGRAGRSLPVKLRKPHFRFFPSLPSLRHEPNQDYITENPPDAEDAKCK